MRPNLRVSSCIGRERTLFELLYSNVYNKSAKVTARMDGAQVEIREQESCFCRTQVPLVFGIAHGYSLTSFALDLYPLEQFNSEQMCWNIGHF